jgi:hypothetical protein
MDGASPAPDAPPAHAGVTIQASLRGFAGILDSALLIMSKSTDRSAAQPEAAAEMFEGWIGTVEPLQALDRPRRRTDGIRERRGAELAPRGSPAPCQAPAR